MELGIRLMGHFRPLRRLVVWVVLAIALIAPSLQVGVHATVRGARPEPRSFLHSVKDLASGQELLLGVVERYWVLEGGNLLLDSKDPALRVGGKRVELNKFTTSDSEEFFEILESELFDNLYLMGGMGTQSGDDCIGFARDCILYRGASMEAVRGGVFEVVEIRGRLGSAWQAKIVEENVGDLELDSYSSYCSAVSRLIDKYSFASK